MESTELVKVEGWALYIEGEEPRVRDIDLAVRLEYAQPRTIRRLIKSLASRGELTLGEVGGEPNSALVHCRSVADRQLVNGGAEREYTTTEYWLTEEQALLVIMASEAKAAAVVRKEVVRVFMLYRRNMLPQQATTLDMRAIRALASEIVSPIVQRMDENFARTWGAQEQTSVRVDRVESQMGRLERKVDALQAASPRRRRISERTKAEHLYATRGQGGRCPCCRVVPVTDDDGRKLPGAEFDHFYASSAPEVEHTWLICNQCHAKLTTGAAARGDVETEFKAYQSFRNRMPDRQTRLFN